VLDSIHRWATGGIRARGGASQSIWRGHHAVYSTAEDSGPEGVKRVRKSPVYFRQEAVGSVTAHEVNKDGQGVTFMIFINAPYDQPLEGLSAGQGQS